MKGRGLIFVLLGVGLLLASGPAGGWVSGTGAVDISRSVVNRMDDFEYYNSMAGNGSFDMGGAKGLSKLGDGEPARTSRLSYSGDVPLVGLKRVESRSLLSGTRTSIEEAFSATEIEKEETTHVGSGDAQLVGSDTKLSFNGTYTTSSTMHQPFSTDVSSHQRFTGKFEIDKMISFGGLTDRRPAITLAVSPTVSSAEVGALVTRNYEVANTGNLPIQGLTLVDSRVGPVALSKSDLNPGEVASAAASFAVLVEDLPGPLNDSVQVTGVDYRGNLAAAESIVTVELIGPLGLNLTVVPLQQCAREGEVVTYIYKIENVGDLPIFGLNLTDSLDGGPIAINLTLPPRGWLNITANGTITEEDLSAPLKKSVTVSGTNSLGELVESSAEIVLPPC
ncbi:DUF7507 domain-containing protein [Methanocrinis sp.]|uniref:DUF7507 domain-containing protein n=1 Tax=Methanocrinis sp. TaxID=3101522 RepID=UPI003D14099A